MSSLILISSHEEIGDKEGGIRAGDGAKEKESATRRESATQSQFARILLKVISNHTMPV